MNLGKSINNLLKRYDEVRVEGIGLFIRKQNPASFDKVRQVFLPPITYIEFDARAEGGYNLTQYIQQQLQLDFQSATSLIQTAVVDVKEQLAQKGQAKLENLGFLISYGDSFVFKPLDLSGFYYSEVLATEATIPVEKPLENSVETPVEPVEEAAAEPMEEAAVEPVEEAAVESVEEAVPVLPVAPVEPTPIQNITSKAENVDEDIISLESEQQAERTSIYNSPTEIPSESSGKVWYIASAVIILAAVAAVFLLNPNLKDQLLGTKKELVPVENRPVIATPVIDTLAQVDSTLVTDSLTLQAENAAKDTIVTEAPLVAAPQVPANWQIVIGTHKSMDQAQAQVNKLKAKGHTTVHALDAKLKANRKKVIWNTYADKAAAEADLIQVQKTIEKSAWLDKIK